MEARNQTAMSRVVVETLATSTAHGISRAAATQNFPLRVTWILLFLCFFGLFCNSSFHLVEKLINVSIVSNRDDDSQVPFELPDLYFCPLNSISGSYPYTLNQSDADYINKEIENLSKLYDNIMMSSPEVNNSKNLKNKARTIFKSLSYRTRRALLQRPEQSILQSRFPKNYSVKTVLTEYNRMCFKFSLSENLNQYFPSADGPNIYIQFSLFTDPYNVHFKYMGEKLNPITYHWTNSTAAAHLWDFENGILDPMPDTGYSILIVDQGKLPSSFESKLLLAPGRAYIISLSMEQVEYNKDLHHKKCSPDNGKLEFVNLMDGSRDEFKPNYHGCLYNEYMHNLHRKSGYVTNSLSIPWSLRDSPRNYNLTDNKMINDTNSWERWKENYFSLLSGSEAVKCKTMIPCVYRKYNAERLSFINWPSFSGKFADPLKNLIGHGPALEQLIKLGEELDSGNYSAHTEALFHKFVSDSMLRVYIGFESLTSPKLTVSYSYSVTAFLADIGGILGLYIGGSLLTFFELIELFYHILHLAIKRNKKETIDGAKSGEDTIAKCQDDDEMTAMSTERPTIEYVA